MSDVRSTWAEHPIPIDGTLNAADWAGAGCMAIPAGYLMVKNDAQYLYAAFDMVGDTGNDTGDGDHFFFSFDVDGNGAVTPMRDCVYAPYWGDVNHLLRWYYLGPGVLNPIYPTQVIQSSTHVGFGSSPNSAAAHRIWEMRIALEEVGVNLNATDLVPLLRFGLRVSSTNPSFLFDFPAKFYADFTNLHGIFLARQPAGDYPPGTAGAVIGGVGLIPASAITQPGAPAGEPGGYATTDPSYFVAVTEAAFGGTVHLIGNRTRMQTLWAAGARKYKILHRLGTAGGWTPIRQAWNNYHWTGLTYVLENFGPDASDNYRLLNPAEDYSIDDLLLQWQTVTEDPGLHQFKAQFFKNDGVTLVPAPAQTLSLRVDNNLPLLQITNILHDNAPVATCALENMTDADDGVRFTITAKDAEGHLLGYSLSAFYGNGEYSPIVSDDYSAHLSPDHKWTGPEGETVPAGEWVPLTTCAYQFRLSANPRVTNGYGYIGYAEATRHVTLIKPAEAVKVVKMKQKLPYGVDTAGKVEVEGETPKKLGAATLGRRTPRQNGGTVRRK